jgi:hypothetical protein
MSVEVIVTVKYKNMDGETVFVRREAEVESKREAKAVFKSAWQTYASEMEAAELAEKEAQHDYDNGIYTLDKNGAPKWL